jgi:YesN/AraC family two-component response regulator
MKKRILIIEDEPLIALDLQQLLEQEGYVVFSDYQNATNAIELINEWQPDLVLLDIELNEEKSGIDIATYLNQHTSIIFCFLTSYSDFNTLEKVKKTQPKGFLVKPFKPQDVISTVYLLLGSSDEIDENYMPFQIKQVIEYIQRHHHERINIKDLAKLTRWEVTHFSRLFKKHLMLTPHQYILNVKIEHAKNKLIESDESLHEIARNLGFGAYSNFFNAFKKITKTTPEKFRLHHQKIK